jgi:two-component system sensor histidine kinase SenX3
MWGRNQARTGSDGCSGADAPPLEEVAGRLEAALDVIGEGILICNQDGEVAFRNSAAGRLLGSGPGDILAVQAVTTLMQQALQGQTADQRLDLLSPTRRTLSIRGFPIVGASGVEGAVAVVEDISERLRLEAVRRDFVANVSHELKTPAGALTLLAETIDGEDDPEVVTRLARRMGAEADRLARIIDELLDLSRIEANETPQQALVPVAAFVGEALDSLKAVADSLEVGLNVEAMPLGLAVPGDRRDLVSAVANLVDNAVKYSEPGGEVRVAARGFAVAGAGLAHPLMALGATGGLSESTGGAGGPSATGTVAGGATASGPAEPSGGVVSAALSGASVGVEISVEDDGVGIPARDLQRIFERFYRVDRARSRATGGTGLGLSIVRHVAANHGGTVGVHSVEGQGSTFVLRLPAVAIASSSGNLRGEDEQIA